MSALWILGLGASVGYLVFKRQQIETNLEIQVREFEKSEATDPALPPDDANFGEVKKAWKHTKDAREFDFSERLPQKERSQLLSMQDQQARQVQEFDRSVNPEQSPQIEGLYLEQVVPS